MTTRTRNPRGPALAMPISEGLFGINPKWREQGWSAYGYYAGADHGVLTETPSTAWPLDRRASQSKIS